ncbi:MAG: copper chaperone [Roseateles depolymerans]|uniref:Copper chaperone n=1 Tax=Roseateles depolymerans TaxID=76731 RepID=A0A2W5DW69_9BURK|nr:MAG: copper chaperone [Roseateles depolymerans]
MTYEFILPDMSCGHCVAAITEAVQQADPAATLAINREAKSAQVDSQLPRETLVAVLTEAGYPPAAAA